MLGFVCKWCAWIEKKYKNCLFQWFGPISKKAAVSLREHDIYMCITLR